jgi:hypothetical protein
MRTKLEKKLIDLIREQYEDRIYTTLLEMDVVKNDGTAMISPGLEVKHKKTGQKFTVQSVHGEKDKLTFNLVSSDGIAGSITSSGNQVIVPSNQVAQMYTQAEIQNNFEI